MRRAIFLTVACCAFAPLIARAADDLAITSRPGLLLLHNGELIAGTITAAGDRYDVTLKDAEFHIKRSDVALVCQNATECYQHKRAGIQQDRVQDHLELAEWCLRNNLLEPAEKELAEARACDSGHPKIGLLQVRLKLAKENPVKRDPLGTDTKNVANDQLDRLVRNLPAGSMEHFTNTVQPLLLNYCSKSGCHGAQSANALRLQRIPISRVSGRHPTQRNLQAALALVNREKPEESPLLKTPIRAHGSAKLPIFTDREQSQYRQLVQWVYLVANAKEPGPAPPPEERGAPLLQTVPRPTNSAEPVAEPKSDEPDWSENFPDQDSDSTDDVPAADQASRSPRHSVRTVQHTMTKRRNDPPAEFTPKDPFDPQIFNRRYFGK